MIPGKKGGYFMIDSLSDEQLLELANHYITTDESLDNFQNVYFSKNKESLIKEKALNMKSKIESLDKANISNNKFPFKEIKYVSDGSKLSLPKEEKVDILNIDEYKDFQIYQENRENRENKESKGKENEKSKVKKVKTPKDEIQKALGYYNNLK